MVKILRIRAIGNGVYKFIALADTLVKFNFTITPGSCCPPFFLSDELYINVDTKTIKKISDVKQLALSLIDDKILDWMNNMKYDPHENIPNLNAYNGR